ncbi:MAG TPA: YigZ family protein [Flavobacteriaceae bacterium]|nr:YigZ family protein [Flavobacteriaceae bacterium]MCB9214151.1 YigZ family protein [Alteromonas sp.]HPF11946.1 YigZ family protein [Flavobacteriaceae bacterium]HQU22610.1 YigZ family protein [Flavobacteriaceae bacterium]HQU65422.1 YigZ family protein [Flavobacteriaceae bacterium]
MEKDTYKTIEAATPEILFKEKGSKFYGYALPVASEMEAKEHLETLKKQHHNARHWCYAWQLGKQYEFYRANDDGEPSNSAGMPIYGQLQSFEVTNTLVVVVRYFGGTKLGVGGLIQAYRTAAQMALEKAAIVERTIDTEFVLTFDYPEMNTVMRIIKEENLTILHQQLELNCTITIAIRQNESERIFGLFEDTYKVYIQKLED